MDDIELRQAIPRLEIKINKRVGAAIRLTRFERRVTQKRLASLLGMRQQRVYRLEAGMSSVSAARLILILQCLGVTPIQFLDRLRQAGKCRTELFSQNAYSTLADGLVADFFAIENPEARSQIRTLIKTMGAGGAEEEVQHHEHISIQKA